MESIFRRLSEKNIPNCAGFSFGFKARGRPLSPLANCRATQKLDDKDKQVGIFFDRNRLSFSRNIVVRSFLEICIVATSKRRISKQLLRGM
ncbi:MAG: hypothetical protein BECKG1743F_GA0114225_105821 [Candidatus Kentron sp. G]|nr:MAG: hypothetical protein BECKG1743F_GA0114225_105821 [Candidatus Kentron sp. G]VFN03136.1 MAG: hypothetical protein BECKG1743E_GA0114224_105841 [Candidatus Kentron sp. G]